MRRIDTIKVRTLTGKEVELAFDLLDAEWFPLEDGQEPSRADIDAKPETESKNGDVKMEDSNSLGDSLDIVNHMSGSNASLSSLVVEVGSAASVSDSEKPEEKAKEKVTIAHLKERIHMVEG